MKKDKISIVIPCFNEEYNIPVFYTQINKVSRKIKSANFEFIFVDDGSSDNTLKIIKELLKKDERVRFISFSRNFGKEAAMFAGMEKSTGNFVVIMDADLQDPPNLLVEMYKKIKENNYDCVALYSSEHKDYSFLRRNLTKIWYKIFSIISSTEQKRGARDCRLMNRNFVNSIINIREYNRYTKGIFSFVGFNTYWMEYEIPKRKEGKSKYSLLKLFGYAMDAILAFSTTPLVISAFIGLLFCLIAFIAIIVIIYKTLLFGDPVSGWPSLACIIIFVSGVQLFFLGVIGMYLAKMYLEIKQRPIYIVRETEKDLVN